MSPRREPDWDIYRYRLDVVVTTVFVPDVQNRRLCRNEVIVTGLRDDPASASPVNV
jgi:hypothetical protein